MIRLFAILLLAVLEIVPAGQAFLRQLQPRDSVLIADQLEYGFRLDDIKKGTVIALPDFSQASNDTLTVVRGWQIDSLVGDKKIDRKAFEKLQKKGRPWSIQASIVLAPFEEGKYELPGIPVQRTVEDVTDTLFFDPQVLEVTTMPVDTATFEIHDIKGLIQYPVTFKEVVPWILGALGLAALVCLLVWLVKRSVRKKEEALRKDPPHIVALRELDKYRSDKFWAPEKQKAFYSGVTDALKNYIDARFGVDAPEMTTAELFDALKSDKDITPELFAELKGLFERADFVKFAKMVVSDEENASTLPVAVKFVTMTYQTEIEKEAES